MRGLEDKNGLNECRNRISVKYLHPLTQKKIVYNKIRFNFLCHYRAVEINSRNFNIASPQLPPLPSPLYEFIFYMKGLGVDLGIFAF